MKKGQTEAIGLMAIVVLILVIGVIFLKFSLGKTDLKPDLRLNIENTNLLRAMMKTTINEDKQVSEALLDCNFDSAQCDPAKTGIKGILDSVLKKNETYKFTVTADNREIMSLGTCEGPGIVASHQLSKEGTFLEAKLKACNE
ncbi:MAG TPA: hypothetical protein VJC07_04060 [Candidatus Nanoarchaeia archaeon]|nr:hypothetical protein [Candidatus Nanoarchaeia archaeon]